MTDKTMRYIPNMYVECGLRVRNFGAPGLAQSDCCSERATSAVETPSGMKLWRCTKHKGLRSAGIDDYALEFGKVHYYV